MRVLAFLKWLFALLNSNTTEQPVVKIIRPPALTGRAIKPDNTPLYIKRGWRIKRNKYQGYYRTPYGAWRGEISRRGDKFNVIIFNPPTEQIQRHSRWPCFHRERKDRWRIDLARNPIDGDLSAIIFYIELIIIESFRK
jgi:hypothetical protein